MSCNRHKEHLLVLPEDDANRQIAVGFQNHLSVNFRCMQILEEARGWTNAKDTFLKTYVGSMRKYEKCLFLLLIDFDQNKDRRENIQAEIPVDLKDRVFILGTESEPEALRSDLNGKPLEKIGDVLAEECAESNHALWNHRLLKHNQPELNRLRPLLKRFLFQND